mmetsp:Transcript_4221/g.4490  ORF Transcript_4221/g.4490 Transcript_4221/m.4490 type:complete len:134 (+) Transcript_4221:1-402(+)
MISQEKRLTEITATQLYLKYRHQNIVNQINVGRGKLKYIPTNKNSPTTTNSTRNAMELLLNELEIESKEITDQARGQMVSVGNGFDDIIVAERISKYPCIKNESDRQTFRRSIYPFDSQCRFNYVCCESSHQK